MLDTIVRTIFVWSFSFVILYYADFHDTQIVVASNELLTTYYYLDIELTIKITTWRGSELI